MLSDTTTFWIFICLVCYLHHLIQYTWTCDSSEIRQLTSGLWSLIWFLYGFYVLFLDNKLSIHANSIHNFSFAYSFRWMFHFCAFLWRFFVFLLTDTRIFLYSSSFSWSLLFRFSSSEMYFDIHDYHLLLLVYGSKVVYDIWECKFIRCISYQLKVFI